MGFRAQMRELLAKEPVSLVPVTERNLPRFDSTLTDLAKRSQSEGMLPVTGNTAETNQEWARGVKALWLVGQKEADFSKAENVAGFVNVYTPEHQSSINEWLTKRGMRAYDPGALLELASFVKDQQGAASMELSADKQALAKVFMDDNFKDVRAATVWVTHTPENKLDQAELTDMKKLGGFAIGSLKYDASENVDSTCFLITRRAFLDAFTGQKRG